MLLKLLHFFLEVNIIISISTDDPKKQLFWFLQAKFQLLWLLCIKVVFCLKYAPNGQNSIEGKLADAAQNCQSIKHISLISACVVFEYCECV